MTGGVQKILALDREDMSDWERELFLKDLNKVIEEYFESDSPPSLEITRTEGGFLVCLILSARRIKNIKRPV